MESSYSRNAVDALEVIVHAKHKPEDVESTTQVFYYPDEVDCNRTQSEIRLIDIDETFINLLEEGERLVFRGTEDEKLVLCSDNATYDVKEGEISNSLVLVPDLCFHAQVNSINLPSHTVSEKKIAGLLSSYLEFRPTFPKLNKLRNLLASARFKGPDKETECDNKGYYVCDLLDTVQCSRNELMQGLKEISACCIDDKWRLLDVEYETRVLSLVINLVESMSWTEIPKESCYLRLKEQIPASVFHHIFNHFTQPVGKDDLHTWLPQPVCRSFATMLLMAGEGKFRYNEFMMAWAQCLPQGLEPDLACLRGLALIDHEGTQQQVVHLFPDWDLPEDVSERFRLLFKSKEKWTLEEIQPYIEKLATKGTNVSTMLTKYSRASTLNGARVFSARHAK